MNTQSSKSLNRHHPRRDLVLAAGRRALSIIAAWTNFLFDGAAGRRLIDATVPPDGVFGGDLPEFTAPRSAGGRVEDSIVLINLEQVVDFTESGEWPGTVPELVAVANALEPFRVIIESDAICGLYTDPLIEDTDRELLVTVLGRLLARRQLLSGQPLTLPQVALLAGLAEKSVRMAAMGRDRNPDLNSYKEGAMVYVTAAEAERWLGQRDSYRPTCVRGDVAAVNLAVRTNHQIAVLLESLRDRAKLSVAELGERMGWNERQLATYARVEEAWWNAEDIDAAVFDVPTVAKLARVLAVDPPLEFVRAIAAFFLPYQVEQQVLGKGTAPAGGGAAS
jgi:hypothetical protein